MKRFYILMLLSMLSFGGSIHMKIKGDYNDNKYYPDIEKKYIDAYISDTYDLKDKFTKLRVIPRENGILNAEVSNWAFCRGKIITEDGHILAKTYGSNGIKARVKRDKVYYVTVTKTDDRNCKWVEIIIPGR